MNVSEAYVLLQRIHDERPEWEAEIRTNIRVDVKHGHSVATFIVHSPETWEGWKEKEENRCPACGESGLHQEPTYVDFPPELLSYYCRACSKKWGPAEDELARIEGR